MNSRIWETTTLALIAVGIVAVIIGLILLIFGLSGNQELLAQLLQSTAKGELYGIVITAGGPFGMWVSAFLLFLFAGRRTPLGRIRLFLRFPEPQDMPPPSRPADFLRTTCSYTVSSDGQIVRPSRQVSIQMRRVDERVVAPFIWVEAPGIENPEFQVTLTYADQEWVSDSYSPKEGAVNLQ